MPGTNPTRTKAILLLSGGLDSILAGKLLLEQGLDVVALNYTSPFCNCSPKGRGCSAAVSAAKQLGIRVVVKACGKEYLEIIKHPRFGRGSGMNPCLDCRIHLFSKAYAFMKEEGAAFIATGEVLGERPMSQRREAMALIERESELSDLLPPAFRATFCTECRRTGRSGRPWTPIGIFGPRAQAANRVSRPLRAFRLSLSRRWLQTDGIRIRFKIRGVAQVGARLRRARSPLAVVWATFSAAAWRKGNFGPR